MKNTKKQLLDSVKAAAARYGLAGLTTRNLAETAGTNDGLIYHYFKDKDGILREAYEQESNAILSAVIGYIREVEHTPLTFQNKVLLFFHRVWLELLSDRERLIFVDQYEHAEKLASPGDLRDARTAMLQSRLVQYFKDADDCAQVICAARAMLFDFTRRVLSSQLADTQETEKLAFDLFYGMLCTRLQTADFRLSEEVLSTFAHSGR